mgnify:CR=1 FL=1
MSSVVTHGNDGTNNVALLCSSAGVLSISSTALPLPTGAATETTLATISGTIAVVGSGVESTAQRVTVATDCVVTVESAGIGTHGNASSAVTTIVANEKSTAINISSAYQCQTLLTTDTAVAAVVEVSQNGNDWYATQHVVVAPADGSYEASFASAAKWARLSYDTAGVLLTATIAGK